MAISTINGASAGSSGTLLSNNSIIGFAQLPTGSVLQVTSGATSSAGSTTSTSYVDTALSITITPKFSSSKILILVDIPGVQKSAFDSSGGFKLQKNNADLWIINDFVCWNGAAQGNTSHIGAMYLDAPASTSALTYKVQYKSFSSSCTFGYNQSNSTSLATITVMEIAG